MALDSEIFDQAFDAAEAKLNAQDTSEEEVSNDDYEKSENKEESSDKENTKSEEVVVEEKQETTKKKGEAEDSKKEASPNKEQISDQNAEADTVEVVEEQPINAPAFWSTEDKALFAKAPPEIRETFLKYDAQRNEWANRVALEAEKGRHYEKRVDQVFEPYHLELQAQGIKDPFEAVERLLAWNKIIEKDPRTAITELLRRNGLSPADLADDYANNTQQEVYDPRYEEVLSKAEKVEKEFEEYKKQQQYSVINAEVENFKNSKDQYGQDRAAFVQAYEPQIAQAIEAIKRIQPTMQMSDILHTAYNFVLDDVRKLHGISNVSVKTAPVKPEQKAAQAEKAKKAASSVTGAPSSGVSVSRQKAKTVDEAIEMAEARLGL